MLVFVAILAIMVYVILDLLYLRLGLVRIDAKDLLLYEVQQSMKKSTAPL